MTLSLSAVFLPILFMEGMVGRLFREFAVTVGVAVLISGVVSLSITPMLCSLLLKPDASAWPRLQLVARRIFDATRDCLRRDAALDACRHRGADADRFARRSWSLTGLSLRGRVRRVSSRARIPASSSATRRAREGITFDEMISACSRRSPTIIQKNPNVEAVMATAGQGTGGVVGDNVGRYHHPAEADATSARPPPTRSFSRFAASAARRAGRAAVSVQSARDPHRRHAVDQRLRICR